VPQRTIVSLALAALLVAAPVQAMVAKPADLRTLVRAARAIVHGRVVATEAQSSDRTRVETRVTIDATTYFKGDLGRRVTFVVPGGTIGRYRTVVSGAPQFAAGEEVVLFLGARAPALPYVVRLGEGVFRIQRDRRTDQRLVTRHPLVGRSASWRPVVRGAPRASEMSFASFTALLTGLVEAQP
jgi:hypothetical protein